MRNTYRIPCVITAAALILTGCSSGLPDSVDTSSLNNDQKAVVDVWYDVSSDADRGRIEKMSSREISGAVGTFSLLCLVGEDQAADQIATGAKGISTDRAARLADAIDDHLCESGDQPKKEPSALPYVPMLGYLVATNPRHDLTHPTPWPDREEATLRVPAHRNPAEAHAHSAPKKLVKNPVRRLVKDPALKAAPPAAKLPAPAPIRPPAVRAPSVRR